MNTSKFSSKVFGKNLNIGNSYSFYCKGKIIDVCEKYATNLVSCHASLEKKKYFFKVKLKIILAKKVELDSIGRAEVPYKALNLALLNLTKRLRRYIRKSKYKNINRLQALNIKETFLEFNKF